MNSTHALELTKQIIHNDPQQAESLLKLLDAFLNANDPMDEAMTRDVMLFIYSQTEHCEQSMERFISGEIDYSHLAA